MRQLVHLFKIYDVFGSKALPRVEFLERYEKILMQIRGKDELKSVIGLWKEKQKQIEK